jgi:hypothetical protein
LQKKETDSLLLFLNAISLLSDKYKAIVRKIGFGSILHFSCTSNVNDVFYWLMNQFNTETKTVTMQNGFSFIITPAFVYKVLGIPFGSQEIKMHSSIKDSELIGDIGQMNNLTVEDLCNMLKKDLDETSFARIFTLLVTEAFIAPCSGSSRPNILQNLLDTNAIPKLDWCTFSLNWLVLSIERYRAAKMQGIQLEIGGCKLILVVCISFFLDFGFTVFLKNYACYSYHILFVLNMLLLSHTLFILTIFLKQTMQIPYFEFLITSEFNLGSSVPRLPLWTSSVVNSYMALDSIHSPITTFGRLAVSSFQFYEYC